MQISGNLLSDSNGLPDVLGFQSMISACLTTGQLQDYLAGELAESEVHPIEAHLQECSVCRHAVCAVLPLANDESESPVAEPMDLALSSLDSESRRELLAIAAFQQAVPASRVAAAYTAKPPGSLPPRYTPVRFLGAGGMGEVWEVFDSLVGRSLAVKFLAPHTAGVQSLQRFLKEASLLGRLGHRGIMQIHEVVTESAAPAILMELVSGPSLQVFLAGHVASERAAAAFVSELCEAVQHAHDQQIVHRDLKPSNILLRPGPNAVDTPLSRDLSAWQPVLTDFGTARMLGDQTITVAGQLVGTPAYMAPEQAGGGNDSGTAVDIYGLGVILYELLTGRPPFLADSPVVLLELVKNGEPSSPRLLRPDLARDLENICLKCLSVAPSDRYQSADLLRQDLQAFLDGRPVTARQLSWPVRTFRWCRRNRRLAMLLSALAGTLLMISAQSVYFGVTQRNLREQATELGKAADANRQVAEDRAVQVESSLKSAISVAERLMFLAETQFSSNTGWGQQRQQLREQAAPVYAEYVRHFCPDGLIPQEHFRVACGLCSLKWQLDPDSVQEVELNRLVASWEKMSESVRSAGDFLELRGMLYYVETEYYRRRRNHSQAGQGFLGWSRLLQAQAGQHPEGSAAMLQCLRIGSGMLQNGAGEFRADGQFVVAAQVAESGCKLLERVMQLSSEDDRDMLNFLFLSQQAAENWLAAGDANTAGTTADHALGKLAARPIRDANAMPYAEQSKAQLTRLLQK